MFPFSWIHGLPVIVFISFTVARLPSAAVLRFFYHQRSKRCGYTYNRTIQEVTPQSLGFALEEKQTDSLPPIDTAYVFPTWARRTAHFLAVVPRTKASIWAIFSFSGSP
jgi:hypothetical protein